MGSSPCHDMTTSSSAAASIPWFAQPYWPSAVTRSAVLERNPVLGGCIRTEELTLPGFHHDTLSTAHPLLITSPGYAELGQDLQAAGLKHVSNDSPTGVLLPDQSSLVLRTDQEANVASFQTAAVGDGTSHREDMAFIGQHAELIFGLLGSQLYSWNTGKLLFRAFRQLGTDGLLRFKAEALKSCRSWLDEHYQSPLTRALLAPWVLHVGLGPDSTMSALMNRVITFTLEQVGMPLVEGGNGRTVEAFLRVIEGHGGQFQTEQDANEILTRGGRAVGVRTTAGDQFAAAKSVICNVTPTQLYGRLLKSVSIPESIQRQAASYRYGRGDMQIHLALDAPPQWVADGFSQVGLGHICAGPDEIARAVGEADRGLLPADPTVVVGQPVAVDPSRAPAGKWILWIQLPGNTPDHPRRRPWEKSTFRLTVPGPKRYGNAMPIA